MVLINTLSINNWRLNLGFKRASILTEEQELELKKKMKPLWYETNLDGKPKYTAKEIAGKLEFGKPKIEVSGKKIDNLYKNLKTHSLYHYKASFGFVNRVGGHKRGKGKHYLHKQTSIMQPDEFKQLLNQNCPKVTDPEAANYDYTRRKRAFLLLNYWSPLRKHEIIDRLRRDFTFEGQYLIINLWREKKYHDPELVEQSIKDPNIEKEPFNLYLGDESEMKGRMLDEVIDWISNRKPNELVFNFSGNMARNYVIDVLGKGFYPHYGRYNYITKAVENSDNPGQLMEELLVDTYMDPQTVIRYIMKNKKHQAAIAKRELRKMRELGMIE